MEEKKQRITNATAALMVIVAIVFDLISFIPIGGQLFGIGGGAVVFLIWFLILGIPLISPKKFLTMLGSGVIESIPVLSILPGITFAVIMMIVITRAEDGLGIEILSSKGLANPTQIVSQLTEKVVPFRPKENAPERPQMNDIRNPVAASEPISAPQAANDNAPRTPRTNVIGSGERFRRPTPSLPSQGQRKTG